MQSIPLRDISNMAHTQQREMLRRVVEQPAAVLTPSVRPSNNQYLDNTEEEMLTKLIDDRARNEQAMGKSSIRQAAADIRSYRTGQEEKLPSKTWYYDLVTRLQPGFKQVKPCAKEHKRADAERTDEIKDWFAILKEHIDKHKYAPGCIFAMDETGLDGEAASRERVLVPKDLKRGIQIKGSLREHISMLHICNAAGHTLPPIFAFQGVWYNAALLDGAPVDSGWSCRPVATSSSSTCWASCSTSSATSTATRRSTGSVDTLPALVCQRCSSSTAAALTPLPTPWSTQRVAAWLC